MSNSDSLREQISEQLAQEAQQLATAGQQGTFDVNRTFHAQVENGEGIIGYQYLHGTNANAGDFQVSGTATVTRNGGVTTVTFDTNNTWNDRIDPNPQYTTDRWKSTFAEIITLGQAEPYDIHISWDDQQTIQIDDATGQPIP
jgi:hypothetical protein